MLSGCVVGEEDLTDSLDSTYAPIHGVGAEGAIEDQYIVVFQDDAPAPAKRAAMDMVAQRRGSDSILRTYTVIPGFAGTLDEETLSQLRLDPNVAYVEQDRTISLTATQSNPRPGLDRIDERSLPRDGVYNDRGLNGTGVHVYVLDTGLRTDHVEFTGRVGSGATAIGDGRGVSDCNGHGTHVSSTVLGTVTGVAKNAVIHPIRVLDCNGSGSISGIVAGVDFVASNGIRPAVANLSLGGGASTTLDNSINNLFNSGVTPVVAAGNENQNACNVSPARVSKAITVAAVDDSDRRASFSNFGSCVDLFAPGVNVFGAGISSSTAGATLSGTSMASPHVAGVAAMFLDKSPSATPTQVTNAILNAATTGVVTNRNSSPNRLLFNGI